MKYDENRKDRLQKMDLYDTKLTLTKVAIIRISFLVSLFSGLNLRNRAMRKRKMVKPVPCG
jgi:hypothetical protein